MKRWITLTGLLLVFLHIPVTHAAVKFWNGTGTGAVNVGRNWSIYSGSGSATAVPTVGDTMVFDSSVTTDANVTGTMTGASIDVRAGYTGTITLGSNVKLILNKLTIGSSSARVRMGTGSVLLLLGNGMPLSGSGTFDATTNTPNTVRYGGPGTVNVGARTYSHLQVVPGGFARDSAIVLSTPSLGFIDTALMDSASGFAYFVSQSSPPTLMKVRLSDFALVATLTLQSGDNSVNTGEIDETNGYIYLATNTSPAKIIKVRLSDLTRIGSITLASGENNVLGSVFDPTAGILYFGTRTSPGKVVRVRTSDFTESGALTFGAGENEAIASAIDLTNGYAYFGMNTSPAGLTKIRLSDFTRVGTFTFNSGENGHRAIILDIAADYGYATTGTSPASVVKFRLSDLSRIGSITLNTGEDDVRSGVIDTTNGFLYLSTYVKPAIVVKIRLSDFTRVGAITFFSNEKGAYLNTIIDTSAGFAYFPTDDSVTPSIVRVRLGSTSVRLGTAASQTLTVNGDLTIGNGINAASVTAATFNPTVDLNGGLVINASGSLIASTSGTFTLAGDLTNKGTFAANGGLLTLDGSIQTLSGSVTFGSLSKTTGSKLFVSAGSAIAASSALTLLGQSVGSKMQLISTQTGTVWTLGTTASRSLQYLAVRDSTSTSAVYCDSCTDSGNNTNWSFSSSSSSAATSSSAPSEEPSPGGGGRGSRGTPRPTAISSAASPSTSSNAGAASSSSSVAAPGPFTDVPLKAWFSVYVAELKELGIISGYTDDKGNLTGTFGPANPVTYAEIIKIGLKGAGQEVTGGNALNASADGTWAAPYVATAEALHLSVLTPSLDVYTPAARGEVIQLLLEAFQTPLDPSSKISYTDLPSDHPYRDAIATATRLGMVNGDTNLDGSLKNTFRPDASINRAEVSKIVSLLLARKNGSQ